ncbi:MAG TPA: DUF1223 domain-containing protein [Patescibacteria group bacterium]|nr:DUF1223 domain-containing protein [Patescibacteria group bacterium]
MADNPVVLELFTSQGCSSCPPADDLLTELSSDLSLLPLSFHIDYWDNLGWKDVFSSPASSKRQWDYARSLGTSTVFTPQLIVDGSTSVVGSHAWDVRSAIAAARKADHPVNLALTPRSSGFLLNMDKKIPDGIELWEIRFVTHAKTDVKRGENGGRAMASVNNVTHISRLDRQKTGRDYELAPLDGKDDGVAIIAQASGQGKILGSAVYIRPGL